MCFLLGVKFSDFLSPVLELRKDTILLLMPGCYRLCVMGCISEAIMRLNATEKRAMGKELQGSIVTWPCRDMERRSRVRVVVHLEVLIRDTLPSWCLASLFCITFFFLLSQSNFLNYYSFPFFSWRGVLEANHTDTLWKNLKPPVRR